MTATEIAEPAQVLNAGQLGSSFPPTPFMGEKFGEPVRCEKSFSF